MSGGGDPRTQFRLTHSHRRSFEWTSCIASPFLRVHSLGGNLVFSRRTRQSNRLDRGRQSFRRRSRSGVRGGALMLQPRALAAGGARGHALDYQGRHHRLQRFKNHALDVRVNVERWRTQKSDQRLIAFAGKIDGERRRR
jgi:hypothetical protein